MNINKDYSNTLELISVNQERSGFSGHDKYDELIFKISKEEYEKNNLNYSQSFDSPEVQLKGKKEYDGDSYICIKRCGITEPNDEYNTLLNMAIDANICKRIVNTIIFWIISLIIIFRGYWNEIKIGIDEDKAKSKRNMMIMSILVSLIAISISLFIVFSR